jgi:hypothetical protein
MYMGWYWLKDRVRQKQFLVYYRPGKDNLADPFTRHHNPAYIKEMKPTFVLTTTTTQLAQLVIHGVSVNAASNRQPSARASRTSPRKLRLTANNNSCWSNNRVAH